MSAETWLAEPIDAVIFGAGTPFTAIPGSRVVSRMLPPPSTLAGAVRTRSCSSSGTFECQDLGALRRQPVHGPLVAVLDAQGRVRDWALPAPADAVVLKDADTWTVQRKVPLALELGDALKDESLAPVGPVVFKKAKPWHRARRLWTWSELEPWLCDDSDAGCYATPRPSSLGVPEPPHEERTHVAIDPETGTARDGMLYGTTGRRWSWVHRSEDGQKTPWRLAMVARTALRLFPGTAALGGKRRLVSWRAANAQDLAFPALPAWMAAHLSQAAVTVGVRLLLATPAALNAGHLPASPPFGAPEGSRLVAVANGRAEVISGWDLEKQRPKPTRRLVPAGSVYFLELAGTSEQRLAWGQQVWASPVSERDPQDGFGLALLGRWSGRPAALTL